MKSKFKMLLILPLFFTLLSGCSLRTQNMQNLSPTPVPKGSDTIIGTLAPTLFTLNPTELPTLELVQTPTLLIVPTPTQLPTRPISLASNLARPYWGIEYPPYPEGVKGFGLLSIIPLKNNRRYEMSIARADNKTMLWFGRYVSGNDNGDNTWAFLDAIELPSSLSENEVLIPNGCKIDDEAVDPEIIVIALLDNVAESTRYVRNLNIEKAWRLNRDTELIESLPVKGIECYADSAVLY